MSKKVHLGKTWENISFANRVIASVFVALAAVLCCGAWYGYNRINTLSEQTAQIAAHIATLESNLASTTAGLEQNISETKVSLADELQKERQNVSAIQQQFGSFKEEAGSVFGKVSTLEKLSRTDPELLQKYSKVFFLNEHYAPPRMVEIPDTYEYHEERHSQIHESVYPYLEFMIKQAEQDNITLYILSAYRSFDTQEALKVHYTVVYGAGTANQFSADQGYSEHQLGTTVDFITPGIGGTLPGFDDTEAYQWLLQNAHKYGFTLSYPEGNEYYVFEPWHWRFVGVKLATHLYNSGKHFYDLDQREIDEYLATIFD